MATQRRQGKNVIILGAGASVHTQAPLMGDFMPRARSILQGRDDFKRLFSEIDKLRASAYYTAVNLDNVEDIFSVFQLAREAGLEGAEENFEDLSRLIGCTLDECCILSAAGDKLRPDGMYTEFVRRLLAANGIPNEDSRPTGAVVDPDPVITFNYDYMLDITMRSESLIPDYAIPGVELVPSAKERKWPLLKLHGSVNWGIHKDCAENKEAITVWGAGLGPLDADTIDERSRGPLRIASRHLRGTKCVACGETGVLVPVIVPPTWAKVPSQHQIGMVWKRAIDELRGATQIIIIGYSLPPTDTVFSYLMALGLRDNSVLRRIVVVNPDERSAARYEQVFSRDLAQRGALQFLPKKFENFVRDTWSLADGETGNLKRILNRANAPR